MTTKEFIKELGRQFNALQVPVNYTAQLGNKMTVDVFSPNEFSKALDIINDLVLLGLCKASLELTKENLTIKIEVLEG